MNGFTRTTLALALSAGAACGAGDGTATLPVSVVPPATPAPPAPPLEPAEVLPGVVVLAGPVGRLPASGWLRTTIDVRVSADAGPAALDWVSPYASGGEYSATFWTNVVEWRVELLDGNVTLHSLDIEWRGDREVGLRFRSDGGIGSDQPTLRCTPAGCTVMP